MNRFCTSASMLAFLLATATHAFAQAPPAPNDQPGDRSEAEAYSLDPVHTRVLFSISHAGYSQALGAVSGSTGALLFDEDDWRSARLDVTVPLARLDLGDGDWNAAALAGNLLDVARFPEARFVSTRVQPIDDTRATVCGDLTLHGQTRPLCMDVTVNQVKRYPLPPFRHTAGFSAVASLSRADFGIDAWKSVIGDTVTLRIEAEARRDNDARERFSSPGPALEIPGESALLPALPPAPDAPAAEPSVTKSPNPGPHVPEPPVLEPHAPERHAPKTHVPPAPDPGTETTMPPGSNLPETRDGAAASPGPPAPGSTRGLP